MVILASVVVVSGCTAVALFELCGSVGSGRMGPCLVLLGSGRKGPCTLAPGGGCHRNPVTVCVCLCKLNIQEMVLPKTHACLVRLLNM